MVGTLMNGVDTVVDLPHLSEESVEKALESLVERGFQVNADLNRENPGMGKYERPY